MIYIIVDSQGLLQMMYDNRAAAEKWIASQEDWESYTIEEEEMC